MPNEAMVNGRHYVKGLPIHMKTRSSANSFLSRDEIWLTHTTEQFEISPGTNTTDFENRTVVFELREDIISKTLFFRALPEKGGEGFTHARICWPFFHQLKGPKIGTFLLKTNEMCMFFVIIIIKITIITIIIFITTMIIINGTFFCHTRKTSF